MYDLCMYDLWVRHVSIMIQDKKIPPYGILALLSPYVCSLGSPCLGDSTTSCLFFASFRKGMFEAHLSEAGSLWALIILPLSLLDTRSGLPLPFHKITETHYLAARSLIMSSHKATTPSVGYYGTTSAAASSIASSSSSYTSGPGVATAFNGTMQDQLANGRAAWVLATGRPPIASLKLRIPSPEALRENIESCPQDLVGLYVDKAAGRRLSAWQMTPPVLRLVAGVVERAAKEAAAATRGHRQQAWEEEKVNFGTGNGNGHGHGHDGRIFHFDSTIFEFCLSSGEEGDDGDKPQMVEDHISGREAQMTDVGSAADDLRSDCSFFRRPDVGVGGCQFPGGAFESEDAMTLLRQELEDLRLVYSNTKQACRNLEDQVIKNEADEAGHMAAVATIAQLREQCEELKQKYQELHDAHMTLQDVYDAVRREADRHESLSRPSQLLGQQQEQQQQQQQNTPGISVNAAATLRDRLDKAEADFQSASLELTSRTRELDTARERIAALLQKQHAISGERDAVRGELNAALDVCAEREAELRLKTARIRRLEHEAMTVEQLRVKAAERGVEVEPRIKKNALVDLVLDSDADGRQDVAEEQHGGE
ncbi:hypothetical protein GGR56DRAFT_683928 [Xylariaceae sp. FL0804]|nr:hypothetical protein GGR56DRAFT_683928 [Xylariaceae sp. FL0804]